MVEQDIFLLRMSPSWCHCHKSSISIVLFEKGFISMYGEWDIIKNVAFFREIVKGA
jgi:hypothetical protein